MSVDTFIRELIREAVTDALREFQPSRPTARAEGTEYLRLSEAAKHAAVSWATIRTWVHRGKLRSYGLGRVLRIRRTELDALLAKGEQEEPQPTVLEQADTIMERLTRKAANSTKG